MDVRLTRRDTMTGSLWLTHSAASQARRSVIQPDGATGPAIYLGPDNGQFGLQVRYYTTAEFPSDIARASYMKDSR